jgi:hypothetical protein
MSESVNEDNKSAERSNSADDKVSVDSNAISHFDSYTNPVVVLTILILFALIAMIGAAILGIDHGFLASMSRAELARGLITYLFTVVTIGIAVALVLSALVGPVQSAVDARFQRGKEILSLLLGVFGTIIGFYFGSEIASANREVPFQVSGIDLSPLPVGPSGIVTVRAVIQGGAPPVTFGLGEADEKVDVNEIAFDGGWIVKQLKLKAPQQGLSQSIHLVVEDSTGKRLDRVTSVRRSTAD